MSSPIPLRLRQRLFLQLHYRGAVHKTVMARTHKSAFAASRVAESSPRSDARRGKFPSIPMSNSQSLAFSRRRRRPSFAKAGPSESERAQGRPGTGWHPWSACNKKARGRTTGSAEDTRPSLHNGFNGFLRALLGDHAWLPPSPVRRESVFTTLAPALERQNHTTSPSAQTPFVRAIIALGDVRPSHPIPNVRDDREPPLYGERDKRKEATDLGVRSITAHRDTLARRANYADEACILRHHHACHSGATRRPNSGLPEFGLVICPSRQQPTWIVEPGIHLTAEHVAQWIPGSR